MVLSSVLSFGLALVPAGRLANRWGASTYAAGRGSSAARSATPCGLAPSDGALQGAPAGQAGATNLRAHAALFSVWLVAPS